MEFKSERESMSKTVKNKTASEKRNKPPANCGWIEVLSFSVAVTPQPQPRQRHCAVVRGRRILIKNYIPPESKVHLYKAILQKHGAEAWNSQPIENPMRVTITFLFERPDYLLTTKSDPARLYCEKYMDLDNLVKSTLDALNGIIWKDDHLIVSLEVRKLHHALGEHPGVYINVYESDFKRG